MNIKLGIFIIISIITFVLILINLYFLKNADIAINNNYLIIPTGSNLDSVCSSEWEILNKNVHFRKGLAFYYTDINKIRVYYELNALAKNEFIFSVKVEYNNSTYKDVELLKKNH